VSPQIEIRLQRVEPKYDSYAEPTVKFIGEITNRANDRVFLVCLQCTIKLRDKGLILGNVPLIISQLEQNQPKRFEIDLSFSIDSNNAVHELLKHQELEDIIFELMFTGFCLFIPPNATQVSQIATWSIPPRTLTIELPVDKYRRLLSTYYRDLAWISVSRETYHKLKELMNRKGATTLDELISTMIEEIEHERRS